MYQIKMIESNDLHNDGIKLLKSMTSNDIELYYINGKPYIKDSNIYFSISHSIDRVVCAISDKEIGIDIEKIRDYDLSLNKELNINAKNNVDFFKEYTRREAYIKKLGKSLKDIYSIKYNNVDTKVIDNYVISVAK